MGIMDKLRAAMNDKQCFRQRFSAILAGVLLQVFQISRSAAEDRVEYRYEDYNEENRRIHIRTHGVGFEKSLSSKIVAKGLLVYDGISGATPTGEAPASGSKSLPMATIDDIRRAASLDLSLRLGEQTMTPQFSYSEESDYISRGIALTHSIDFNQKNTTLVLGVAHNFDEVAGGALTDFTRKDTTDFMLGVNQLLGPKTVLAANLTFGYADGYLNDPYRLASFILPESPDPIFSDPASVNPVVENRPRHPFKQVGFFSLTQYITPLNASVEGTYRLYHDDWGILSSTVGITWNQKITRFFTLSPLLRYYRQTAADFYSPFFNGVSFSQYAGGTQVAFQDGVFYGFADDPAFPAPADQAAYQILNVPARPSYYSADYRLSEMEAFTFGTAAQFKFGEHFTLDLAYKRYEMHGLDRVTPEAAYPAANVFTIGCGIWF